MTIRKPLLQVAALVALFFVAASNAHAQTSCGNSMNPNTVCGRLGAGQQGAPQAIPFAALIANMFGASTKNTLPGDVYFAGRPFCDPRSQGAVGDGVTNNLTAFNACLTALGGNGGTIWLDSIPGVGGLYCLKASSQGGIFNINVPVRLIFASPNVSLSSCGSGFSTLEISAAAIIDGAANGQILGPGMDGTSTFGATEPTLILTSAAGSTKLMNLDIYGGSPTIQWNCGECQAYNVNAAFAYAGNASGIVAEWYIQGGGGELYNVSADDAEYPYGTPTPPFTYTAWATNQSVATNAVRTATCQDGNSYVIQAKVGGTTASSGTGPNCKNYGGVSQTFTDGTVTWSLSHPTLLYHWQIDTGAADVHIHQADTGGGNIGFGITNTLAGSAPNAVSCVTCNGGVSYAAQVDAAAGTNVVFLGSLFQGCLETGCSAIKFESTFGGGATIDGGYANSSPVGISIAGGTNYRIIGVDLTSNTTALSISGSASKITAIGNNTNGSTTGASISGTSSDIIFADNVGCVSGATTCVSNSSSGANIITNPNDDGTIFNTTSVTTPTLYGGTAPGATLIIKATSNGSPSGDIMSVQSSDIILRNPGTGTTLVQIGVPTTTSGRLQISDGSPGGGDAALIFSGTTQNTLTLPSVANDTIAVLAAAQTFSGADIFGSTLKFTGLSGGSPSKYVCLDSSNFVVSSATAC
ncbi:MAG TPA: hypothetical protein VK749_15900 [Xanthobacteraceae bacterium]|jgi:hypothetical protein|nr:hypothetical protein [Xanthobacteraceae bacterium]